MLRRQTTVLVQRSVMKTPTYNNFTEFRYPEMRVYKDLMRMPLFKTMSKIVLRFLWRSASREEYRTRSLIANGTHESDFDFLYVMKGSMRFKLDQCRLDGTE